jgi:hypothetical protein
VKSVIKSIFLSIPQYIPTDAQKCPKTQLFQATTFWSAGTQPVQEKKSPTPPLHHLIIQIITLTRHPPAHNPQTANLQSLLALRPAAAHAPGLRALQVSGGDPALVKSTSLCAAGDGRAVGTNDGNLVGGVDLLGLAGGALGALAALAAALLLGEESGDPGVVDEVDDAAEGGEEEEVEEDAGREVVLVCGSFLYFGVGDSSYI